MQYIPELLKNRPGWVLWKTIEGRKMPFKIDGVAAGWNQTRYSYAEVMNVYTDYYDGVGLQPLGNLACLDLDECIGPNGEFVGPAAELTKANTYIEWGPSGDGVHIWFLHDGDLKTRAREGVELFAGSKFVTVTGKAVNDVEVKKYYFDVEKYFNDAPVIPGRHTADPYKKTGVIGAFCRAIDIHEALEMTGMYTRVDDTRYHYNPSQSAPGVLTYEDKYVISNHASDPAFGSQHNAFDIVKIHKFGESKEKLNKMLEYAVELEKVKKEILNEFDEEWEGKLKLNAKGNIKLSMGNICLILKNKFEFKYNILEDLINLDNKNCWFKKSNIFENADICELKNWLEHNYGFTRLSNVMIEDCVTIVARLHAFHPVKEALEALPAWDGKKRVEELLIKCFGAEDSAYTRAVTKKFFAAAIKRIYVPGCKFDYVLTLIGKQGLRKSTFLQDLAMGFFTDDFALTDTRDKGGAEKIIGKWIIEIGEMVGMRKADMNAVKSFITRTEDRFRPSYGRVVEQFKRVCVFAATSNDDYNFLQDPTGGRRWWIVKCNKMNTEKIDVKQLWAEALTFWRTEQVYLEPELEIVANEIQKSAIESDERTGLIKEFLDKLITPDWYDKTIEERKYFTGAGNVERENVSIVEIWTEGFKKNPIDITVRDTREIAKTLRILGYERIGDKRLKGYGKSKMWKYKNGN
jgi:predicted P-loop ATPase